MAAQPDGGGGGNGGFNVTGDQPGRNRYGGANIGVGGWAAMAASPAMFADITGGCDRRQFFDRLMVQSIGGGGNGGFNAGHLVDAANSGAFEYGIAGSAATAESGTARLDLNQRTTDGATRWPLCRPNRMIRRHRRPVARRQGGNGGFNVTGGMSCQGRAGNIGKCVGGFGGGGGDAGYNDGHHPR